MHEFSSEPLQQQPKGKSQLTSSWGFRQKWPVRINAVSRGRLWSCKGYIC